MRAFLLHAPFHNINANLIMRTQLRLIGVHANACFVVHRCRLRVFKDYFLYARFYDFFPFLFKKQKLIYIFLFTFYVFYYKETYNLLCILIIIIFNFKKIIQKILIYIIYYIIILIITILSVYIYIYICNFINIFLCIYT